MPIEYELYRNVLTITGIVNYVAHNDLVLHTISIITDIWSDKFSGCRQRLLKRSTSTAAGRRFSTTLLYRT